MKTNQAFQARLEATRQFIRSHWEDNHFSPSVREIANQLHISTSMANYYLDALVTSGWLEERHTSSGRGTGKARNIVPAEIFADRPVFPEFPDENFGPSPLERVAPIINAQLGIMTEFPGMSDIANINTISKEKP